MQPFSRKLGSVVLSVVTILSVGCERPLDSAMSEALDRAVRLPLASLTQPYWSNAIKARIFPAVLDSSGRVVADSTGLIGVDVDLDTIRSCPGCGASYGTSRRMLQSMSLAYRRPVDSDSLRVILSACTRTGTRPPALFCTGSGGQLAPYAYLSELDRKLCPAGSVRSLPDAHSRGISADSRCLWVDRNAYYGRVMQFLRALSDTDIGTVFTFAVRSGNTGTTLCHAAVFRSVYTTPPPPAVPPVVVLVQADSTDPASGRLVPPSCRLLPVVACEQSLERKVLVKRGPVQPEGGYLNLVQLLGGASGEAFVAFHGKPDFDTAAHADDDMPIFMLGRNGTVSQGAHATSAHCRPESTVRNRYAVREKRIRGIRARPSLWTKYNAFP
jgi:hypothetical protein